MSSKENESNLEDKKGNSPDKFSFLEFNDFLNSENIEKEAAEKYAKKKSQKVKKESEKKPELKIKPNSDLAREHTNDDLMYIEKEEDLKKEDLKKEELEKEIKKEKKVEKKIPQKNIEQKKPDRNIVKIDLNKLTNDNNQKNKEEKELDKNGPQKKKTKAVNIETIISKIKEEDPQAYTPTILPFEKDQDIEKSLKEELVDNQNKFLIFQFPRQIPIKDLKSQIEIKEQENIKEEPKYDSNGFLESPEFTNTFKEIKDNTVLGKLVIMKSGKIKIKMGDINFDINQGSLTKFAQYSTIITEDEENKAFILGQPLNKKLIVTPEFE